MRRRKPDLLLLLAIIIGLGVLITGFTQEKAQPTPHAMAQTARQP